MQIGLGIDGGFPDAGEAFYGIQPAGDAFQGGKIRLSRIAIYDIADGRGPLLQQAGVAIVDKFRIQTDLIEIGNHILHIQAFDIEVGVGNRCFGRCGSFRDSRRSGCYRGRHRFRSGGGLLGDGLGFRLGSRSRQFCGRSYGFGCRGLGCWACGDPRIRWPVQKEKNGRNNHRKGHKADNQFNQKGKNTVCIHNPPTPLC